MKLMNKPIARLLTSMLIIASSAVSFIIASAASGDLDTSFDTDGNVISDNSDANDLVG